MRRLALAALALPLVACGTPGRWETQPTGVVPTAGSVEQVRADCYLQAITAASAIPYGTGRRSITEDQVWHACLASKGYQMVLVSP